MKLVKIHTQQPPQNVSEIAVKNIQHTSRGPTIERVCSERIAGDMRKTIIILFRIKLSLVRERESLRVACDLVVVVN